MTLQNNSARMKVKTMPAAIWLQPQGQQQQMQQGLTAALAKQRARRTGSV